jgi:hypothetical protein
MRIKATEMAHWYLAIWVCNLTGLLFPLGIGMVL